MVCVNRCRFAAAPVVSHVRCSKCHRGEPGGAFDVAAPRHIIKARHGALPVPARKIDNRGSTKVIGAFFSRKNGKHIWCESTLERDYCYLLEADCSVESYREQPETLSFRLRGARRKWTPDFEVTQSGGGRKWIEVKPVRALGRKNCEVDRQLAWARICAEEDHGFGLITDQLIRIQPRLTNLKLTYAFADLSNSSALLPALRTLLGSGQISTVADAAKSLDCVHAMGMIYGALWSGAVSYNIDKALSLDSDVWLPVGVP